MGMVHRVQLNDPSLTCFDFSKTHMPRPESDPRISSKLCRAIAHNTYIKELILPNANLQRKDGAALGESLKSNSTIEVLNVDSNCLDCESLATLIEGVGKSQSI